MVTIAVRQVTREKPPGINEMGNGTDSFETLRVAETQMIRYTGWFVRNDRSGRQVR